MYCVAEVRKVPVEVVRVPVEVVRVPVEVVIVPMLAVRELYRRSLQSLKCEDERGCVKKYKVPHVSVLRYGHSIVISLLVTATVFFF